MADVKLHTAIPAFGFDVPGPIRWMLAAGAVLLIIGVSSTIAMILMAIGSAIMIAALAVHGLKSFSRTKSRHMPLAPHA